MKRTLSQEEFQTHERSHSHTRSCRILSPRHRYSDSNLVLNTTNRNLDEFEYTLVNNNSLVIPRIGSFFDW